MDQELFYPGLPFSIERHRTIIPENYKISIRYITNSPSSQTILTQIATQFAVHNSNFITDDQAYHPVIVLLSSTSAPWCMDVNFWWSIFSYHHSIAYVPGNINPTESERVHLPWDDRYRKRTVCRTIADRDAVLEYLGADW